MIHKRPAGIPATITREQFDEYRRLSCDALRALGVDPYLVVLNGARTVYGEAGDYVEVEFLVPADGWDGTGIPPAQADEWRENEIRKGVAALRVTEVGK